jgi:hypothetical protein
MLERFTIEDVKIIEGEGALATLHHLNLSDNLQVAYHGCPHPINEVEAAMPYWTKDGIGYPDSAIPVVCALQEPLIPAFYALAPSGHRKYFGTEEGGVRLLLDHDKLEEFYEAAAYVAVLDCSSGFEVFSGNAPVGWPEPHPIRLPELRSSENKRPLLNMKVTFHDFFQLLSDNPKASFELV